MGNATADRQCATGDVRDAPAAAEGAHDRAVLVHAKPSHESAWLEQRIVSDLDGSTQGVRPVQQRPEPSDDDQPVSPVDRDDRRVGAVIPAEGDRDAVEEYGGLTRFGPANGKLLLTARILANVHEGRFEQRLVEQRRGLRP